MKTILLISMFWFAMAAQAAPRLIATINDPVEDDNGNGSLIHPQRSDYQPGDLDIVRLKISRDVDGYWFEATFKNAIRDPANAFSTGGRESLAYFARKGFYQFNLDIYIDTDRVMGAGNTFTLPGRKVKVDAANAWEKAVVLTPQPEAMRSRLLEVLERQFPDRPKGEAAASIDQSMFFPTHVQVRGKSVTFLVPAKFIGESDAASWTVTAFVTGAKTDLGLNFSLLPGARTPLEDIDLGVMQPAIGRPRDTFGFASGIAPSPVVDLLAPAPGQQAQVLSGDAALPGVTLGGAASSLRLGEPSPVAKPAAPAGPSWGDAPTPRPTAAEVGAGAATGTAAAATALKDLLEPAKRPEPAGASDPVPPARASIAKRLETLQQLLDQKLITEAEFKQQRQRILNEL